MPGGGDPDPERLLQEARSGENRALGQLLEMYRSYLTLFSQLQIDSRMQGKADPSDLVQETFLQAQRGFDQFRGNTERELLGWLRRILVSQLAKLVRRFYGTQRRDSRLERELEEDFDRSSQAARMLIAPHSSPSQGAMRREQVVLMADALEKLPKDYREVIVLRHFKDLSFPEVARRLGRSEEAVKKTWARALVALREAFGEATDERQ